MVKSIGYWGLFFIFVTLVGLAIELVGVTLDIDYLSIPGASLMLLGLLGWVFHFVGGKP